MYGSCKYCGVQQMTVKTSCALHGWSVCVVAECSELYGHLEDSASASVTGRRRLVCNSERRVQQLIVSRGHIVRVWLDGTTGSQLRRFLIHYSGIYITIITSSQSSYHIIWSSETPCEI